MNNSLLLNSSTIFPNSNIIDRVRQSSIDLETNPSEEEVQSLLSEALKFLDNDFDVTIAAELFSLIISCFYHFPNQPLTIFEQLLQTSKINSNHIIITASIFSYITHLHPNIKLPNYDSFASDSFMQVIPQIKNRNFENFKIFNCKIPSDFIAELTIDIILLKKLTRNVVLDFYPFIFSQKSISNLKLNFFIEDASKLGLISLFSESILLETNIILQLSLQNLENFILKLPEQTFRKILPQIEEVVSKSNTKDHSFSVSLLNKCSKYNIKCKIIENIISHITESDLNPAIWKYLYDFDIKIPKILSKKIHNVPNAVYAFKVLTNIENLTNEKLTEGFLNTTDLRIYESVLHSNNLQCNVFSSSKFWIHIMSVVSDSEEQLTKVLMDRFIYYFEKFIKPPEFNQIFDEMILYEYPPNFKKSSFLITLFKQLSKEYCDSFRDRHHQISFVPKIIAQNKIPPSILCELFDFFYCFEKVLKNNPKPHILYEYEFSHLKGYGKHLDQIQIMPQTNSSRENLIEFINNFNKFDLVMNLNDEELSIAACAFIFTSNKDKTDVFGLSKETILPFLAVSFNYIKRIKKKFLILNEEILNLAQEGCIFLNNNDSPLLIASINSILSDHNILLNTSFIPTNIAFQMIGILLSSLLNGQYKADQTILLKLIFYLSCEDSEQSIQEQALVLFNNFGTKLFEFITDNNIIVNNRQIFDGYLLNLSFFDASSLSELIVKKIQNSSENHIVINTIKIILNHCKYLPDLFISSNENVSRVANELINEEKWDDLLSILHFMKKNNFKNELQQLKDKKIPFHIKQNIFNDESINIDIHEIITSILSDPNPEEKEFLFKTLFNILLKDSSVISNYCLILLEKNTKNMILKTETIINNLYELQKEYQVFFTNCLCSFYAFNSSKKSFIRKVRINNINLSESISSLISNLLQNKSFQSFVCLKNIASSFPFLFAYNFEQLINAVLQALDSFSLLFDFQDNEENTNNLKTSIAALSFLHSCLYSTKIIQDFIPWLFRSIKNLNDSQVLSLLLIVNSLFDTKNVNAITLSIAMKFDFLKLLTDLLQRDINNKSFLKSYRNVIYMVANNYYHLLTLVTPNMNHYSMNYSLLNEPIVLDHFKYIENPFDLAYNNFLTILPNHLKHLNIPFDHSVQSLNKIINFFENVDMNERKFWICYESNAFIQHQSQEAITNFIRFFANMNQFTYKLTDLPPEPYQKSLKMLRFIASQPKWISEWILQYRKFPMLKEHFDMLKNTFTTLKQIEVYSQYCNDIEDVLKANDFDLDDLILPQYCQENLFKELIKEAAKSQSNNELLFDLIKEITKNGVALISFLQFISEFMIMSSMNNDTKSIERLLNILVHISKNDAFENNFVDLCENKLFKIILSPRLRSDSNFLLNVAKALNILNQELPSCATHIIGFILSSNDSKKIPQAIELYSKIKTEKNNLDRIAKFAFNREFNKKKISYLNIKYFLDHIPSLAENNTSQLYSLVNICINKYKKNQTKNNDLLELISSVFNYLAPKRNQSLLLLTSDSTEIDFTESLICKSEKLLSSSNHDSALKPAPPVLHETSPQFWSLYEKHRHFLNELINNNETFLSKFTFLLEYFELVSFHLRAFYFREKMKEKIKTNRTINLIIHRNNVLRDSFEQLHKLPPQNLLSSFHVHFDDEKGADLGGLTREWFTLVIQELFNSNYALFKQTKSKSYQPRMSSSLIPNYNDYFHFAGQLIARALVSGDCVNAHLTVSFYRQILHRKVKLKDLEDYKPAQYRSFSWMLENDVEPLEMTFSIDVKEFGEIKNIPLKENGENINLTNENKIEYISLCVNYYLRNSIKNQITSFCKGFDELIPPDDIKMFSPSELDLLICGIPQIDLNDLKKNIVYNRPYNANHPVIIMFFNVISNWKNDNLAKFLLFLTGSSQVPLNGFKDYSDRGNPIKINPGGDRNRMPVAHTCFNMLDLPTYESEEEMNEKLERAIQEHEFGII